MKKISLVLLFSAIAFGSCMIIANYFEGIAYLSGAVFLYRLCKIMIIAQFLFLLYLLCKSKKLKFKLHTLVKLNNVCIPIICLIAYVYIANYSIPDKYHKLTVVDLVHRGEYEKVNILEQEERSFSYSGDLGKEDVFFNGKAYKNTDDREYYSTGYLFSHDNVLNTSVGMYQVVDITALGNNWYKLRLILAS